MDRYLTSRQARTGWGDNVFGFFTGSNTPKKPNVPPKNDEKVEKMEEIKEKEQEIKEIEEDIGDLEAVEVEEEQKKEAVLSRMFSKLKGFFGPGKDDEDFGEENSNPEAMPLDEELKEVLKITFKWVSKLPPEELKEFKSSPDFEKYKLVLKKYGLIK